MKRIGIDARVIERRMSGIGRYLLGLLEHLLKIDKKNQYFLFCYKDLPKFKKIGYNIIATGKTLPLPQKIYNLYWLNFILPSLLKKYKIDIFFSPNPYLPYGKIPSRAVFTIHDLAHKIEKKYKDFIYRIFYLNFLSERSARRADLILTVSENSKKDILKYYANLVSKDKVKVIYPAADEKFKVRELTIEQIKNLREKYNLPERFVLYVGRIETRKNIIGILKIGDFLKKKGEDIKIVLVGEGGYSGYEKLKREIEKRNNVYHLENVNEKDLPYIYNLSKIFLFPSFYEGFGLPVLEAMQSGVPVLASNTSSLKEVVGDGGIMHNPTDYEAFAKDIIRLLKDNKFYEKIRKKGISQAKKFSWEKSTKELVKIFNEL